METDATQAIVEAAARVDRLLASRTRQGKRLVKAHALHQESRGRSLPTRVERILRCDRLLRDRFRDRIEACTLTLSAAWREGDEAARRRVMAVVERAVRRWPAETKVEAKLLLFLAHVVCDAREDTQVLQAWHLLRAYVGGRDESLRSLIEQRGVALGMLIERARDASMRAGEHEAALALNRMILERRQAGHVEAIDERAWFAQLELFRATRRTAAGQAFAEKVARWSREANREDLLDRIAEWEERFRVAPAPPLLLRIRSAPGRLEIEAAGTAGDALSGRPRQRALLALTFAYPSGFSVEDAAHMLDVMWRLSSPKWPGPGGKLSLSPLPANLNDLSHRMVLVKDAKIREAMQKLVSETIESCVVALGERLLRLVDSRIERDDPKALVRVEIGEGSGRRAAQPSDVSGVLRDVCVVPLVEYAQVLGDQDLRPAGPGRPRTINSSRKRERLAIDEEEAP